MRVEPPVPADALAAIRAPLQSAGVTLADAPLLQPLNLLLDLAGEAMRARLFVVQAEGGAELCLRPDFTVPLARAHVESGRSAGRYGYLGPVFRAAVTGADPDEIVQLGLEALGDDGRAPEAADAEMIRLAWRSGAAGGRQDLSLWLGDVALFSAFIDSLGLTPALAGRLRRVADRPRMLQAELARTGAESSGEDSALTGLLRGLSADRAGALLEEVWSLAGIEPVGGRSPAEIAARLVRKAEATSAPALTEAQAAAIRAFMAINDAPEAALATIRELAGPKAKALDLALQGWRLRLDALCRVIAPEKMRFTPALGHAFDYYDGLVFEIRSEAHKPARPLAVGGRYDGLLTRLGGPDNARAVGCMVRPWRAWVGGEA